MSMAEWPSEGYQVERYWVVCLLAIRSFVCMLFSRESLLAVLLVNPCILTNIII